MNRAAFEISTNKRRGMNKSYLASKLPPGRYALFLRANLLVFAGYLIATLETLIGIYLGLTNLTYENTLFISFFVLLFSFLLLSTTYFKKNILIWQEWTIFGIYLFTFLIAFSFWVYWLGELRFLGVINALTAVAIVLSYTNVFQSLMMSISTLICYYTVTWYSIKIAGQSGSLLKETFFAFCILPGFILISIAAYYINQKRKDLHNAKKILENVNYNISAVNDKLRQKQLLSEIEMDLANEIQCALFPRKVPDTSDWDTAFISKPFGAVTGDFYDFYSSSNCLKGISLFDVSGHGVAPALITILAKHVLYAHFIRCESSGVELGEVLESADSDLLKELEEVNVYITGLMLRMNGHKVEYANAGHPDLLYFHSSIKKVDAISDPFDSFKGHPLGISLLRQEYKSFKFNVKSGDFLISYTDGLIEGRNYMGEHFGISRLSGAIASFHGNDAYGLLKHIMESFNNFTGNVKPGDDITIIVLRKI